VFSLATVLAARLGAVPAAAHQVVLQIASFAFMVPMGISAAGTVRVGQAIGRGDAEGARLAGWSAVGLGVGCMATSAVAMVLGWKLILAAFQLDPEVTALARQLLLVAGFFQLFDGAQVTLAGVLRGLGETVSSLVANLVGHWAVGLPVGMRAGLRARMGSRRALDRARHGPRGDGDGAALAVAVALAEGARHALSPGGVSDA
jgi:MATE family multidrug resistance protein